MERIISIEMVFASGLVSGFILSLAVTLLAGSVGLFGLLKYKGLFRILGRLRLRGFRPRGREISRLIPAGSVPLFMGLSATLFGGAGLFFRLALHMDVRTSIIAAAFIAFSGCAAFALSVISYFSGGQASEMISEPFIGLLGHISVPIPKEGVGQVAYVSNGKRVTLPARSRNGKEVERGRQVIVMEMQGHTAVVKEFLH